MVRVWYISGPEQGNSLSVQELQERSGVVYYKLNTETYAVDGSLEEIKTERGYTYQDEIDISPARLPNYYEKVKAFHKEHLHAEEEIRFVLDGSVYFDVRDSFDDTWIRVEVVAGDMIVLPAGVYHRLTLVEKEPSVRLLRLFLWKPTWSCYNRPADDLECRINYINNFKEPGVPVLKAN